MNETPLRERMATMLMDPELFNLFPFWDTWRRRDGTQAESYWAVQPSGNERQDFFTGMEICATMLRAIDSRRFKYVSLRSTLEEMVEKGKMSGIEQGFIQQICHRVDGRVLP